MEKFAERKGIVIHCIDMDVVMKKPMAENGIYPGLCLYLKYFIFIES